MLRHLPLEPGVSQDAPFRIRGISLKAAQNRWSRRVQYVISAAKVTHVDLPDGRTKAANVKQLRHTAAVRWLRQGQRGEEVAKMLGHTNAEMVRRYYAPWVKDMDVAHVSRVVSQWKCASRELDRRLTLVSASSNTNGPASYLRGAKALQT